MEQLKQILSQELTSSSGTTKEFTQAFNAIKKILTKTFKDIEATDITFNKGHFAISGFLKSSKGQYYYFSLSDLRSQTNMMLIRTAQSNNDYTGGTNQYISIDTFVSDLKRIVK